MPQSPLMSTVVRARPLLPIVSAGGHLRPETFELLLCPGLSRSRLLPPWCCNAVSAYYRMYGLTATTRARGTR